MMEHVLFKVGYVWWLNNKKKWTKIISEDYKLLSSSVTISKIWPPVLPVFSQLTALCK